jgi:hypothetical protein
MSTYQRSSPSKLFNAVSAWRAASIFGWMSDGDRPVAYYELIVYALMGTSTE